MITHESEMASGECVVSLRTGVHPRNTGHAESPKFRASLPDSKVVLFVRPVPFRSSFLPVLVILRPVV